MSGHKLIATNRLRSICLVGLLAVALSSVSQAQAQPQSNVHVLGQLAINCIGDVPDSLSAFLLESSERMPYLRPRLTGYWKEKGHQVFMSDTLSGMTGAGPLARLRYDPEEALVTYDAAEDSQLKRTIIISIGHSLVAPSGLLLDEGRCRDQFSDTIRRSDVVLVQRDPFPETRAEIPPEGSWKTWAEPVVLGAAVGLVTYLFFTIRST